MPVSPLLTIQLVGWNSAADLTNSLPWLHAIPKGEATIRYIDNASTDNSLALVRRFLPEADVIALKENSGFARGHNIGLRRCQTPFVLILNPDVMVSWAGIIQLLHVFTDQTIGALQGKILQQTDRHDSLGRIDSAGIVLTRALNGWERGAGEIDTGQYDEPATIIAPTGACALYRLTALQDVAPKGEYFDEDFFAYKEDVDLGWRLTRSGWQVKYYPIQAGWHRRSLKRQGRFNWGLTPAKIWSRLRSPKTRYSIRNWIWLMAKNSSWRQELTHEFFIDSRLFVLLWLSLLYLPLWSVWWESLNGLSYMIKKR